MTSERQKIIDNGSKKINNETKQGIKDLAELVDINYLTILPHIFGDETIDNDEIILLILKDAKIIYNKSENIFREFKKMFSKIFLKSYQKAEIT